jgi:hypothetical protein
MKDETEALLDTRTNVYGDRIDNMVQVAKIWSGYLGIEIEPWKIPLLMAAYKRYRTFQTPDYSDNVDDDEGWTKMFRETYETTVGPIITARTVEEYERKKNVTVMTETRAIEERYLRAAQQEPIITPPIDEQDFADQEEIKESRRPSHLRLVQTPPPITLSQEEGQALDVYMQNRCGYSKGIEQFCRSERGHAGVCDPRP